MQRTREPNAHRSGQQRDIKRVRQARIQQLVGRKEDQKGREEDLNGKSRCLRLQSEAAALPFLRRLDVRLTIDLLCFDSGRIRHYSVSYNEKNCVSSNIIACDCHRDASCVIDDTEWFPTAPNEMIARQLTALRLRSMRIHLLTVRFERSVTENMTA